MEPNVVYQCKRHIFELVEEFSDMVWWCLFLVSFFVPLAMLVNYPRLGLIVILAIFPIGRFVYEIVAWKYEVYEIIEAPKDTLLIKKWGIMRRQQISESVKGIAVQTSRLLPWLDWETVHIRSVTHIFIEGKRVPTRLAKEILKSRMGLGMAEQSPAGNQNIDMLRVLPTLVQNRLCDPVIAKGFTEGTLTGMMGVE